MLAILSAYRHIRPDAIYFHTNNAPNGPYWDSVTNLTGLRVVHRDPPRIAYGVKIKEAVFETSDSDVDRVLLLQEYGGIYLDTDVMVVKSFDDLRKYPCTLGLEGDYVCGGIIIAAKDSTFLALWINYFLEDYRVDKWAYNSGEVPTKLATRYPQLVHIEKESLNRPNYKEMDKIWGSEKYDWRNKNYAIHTWIRLSKRPKPTPENIKKMNGTFGEIARLVVYGRTDML